MFMLSSKIYTKFSVDIVIVDIDIVIDLLLSVLLI